MPLVAGNNNPEMSKSVNQRTIVLKHIPVITKGKSVTLQ